MRKLTLKKETLTELSADDLLSVLGGAGTQTCAVCSDFASCFPTADHRQTCRCAESLVNC